MLSLMLAGCNETPSQAGTSLGLAIWPTPVAAYLPCPLATPCPPEANCPPPAPCPYLDAQLSIVLSNGKPTSAVWERAELEVMEGQQRLRQFSISRQEFARRAVDEVPAHGAVSFSTSIGYLPRTAVPSLVRVSVDLTWADGTVERAGVDAPITVP